MRAVARSASCALLADGEVVLRTLARPHPADQDFTPATAPRRRMP